MKPNKKYINRFIPLLRKMLGEKRYINWRNQYLFGEEESSFLFEVPTPVLSRELPEKLRSGSLQAVFLISPTQRSGSNYLRSLIGLHPDLRIPENDNWPNEFFLHSTGDLLRTYGEFTTGMWRPWISDGSTLDTHMEEIIAAMGEGILSYIRQGDIRPPVLGTPDAKGINNVFTLFPSSKAVILVRDGRDTAESFIRSWGSEGIFEKFCHRWASRVEELLSYRKAIMDSDFKNQFIIIKYEDLVVGTKEVMEEIIHFLEIDLSNYPFEQIKNIGIQGSSFFRGSKESVHWEPLSVSKDFNPIGRWKTWNESKKTIFKNNAGKELIKLGYEEGMNW